MAKLLPFQTAAARKSVREGMQRWGKWMMDKHGRYEGAQMPQAPRGLPPLTEEEARKQAQLTQPRAFAPAPALPATPLRGWHHRPGESDDST